MSIFGGLISGLFGLGSQLLQNESNERINDANIQAANANNAAQLALSREALEAQQFQQNWANQQYLESRDYNRALQQTIFNREDTAISRAVDDAKNSGFSPLAALGMSLDSGSVVSSSSAPGSMVSNNQANLSVPNLKSNDYGNLAQAGSQIAQILATSFESKKAQDNQVFITEMQLAEQADQANLGRLHDKMIKSLEHDFLRNEANTEHYRQLMYKLSDQKFQLKLQDIIASNNMSLQQSQHDFQSSEAEKARGSEKNRATYLNQIIKALSDGDSKMSRWLRENSDLLIPVIQYIDSIVAE